jgi:hypothetical protein
LIEDSNNNFFRVFCRHVPPISYPTMHVILDVPVSIQILRFRWLSSLTNKQKLAWMSFGMGPRTCIGMRLAYMELKLTLIRILQSYTVLACQETEASFKTIHFLKIFLFNGVDAQHSPFGVTSRKNLVTLHSMWTKNQKNIAITKKIAKISSKIFEKVLLIRGH